MTTITRFDTRNTDWAARFAVPVGPLAGMSASC